MSGRFEVVQVPVWTDNYAYLLCPGDGTAALVDGPEAGPILTELENRYLRLTHVFNTHHHYDHVGANEELLRTWPDLEICGSRYDFDRGRVPGQTRVLEDGEEFQWGGESCRVREVPAHTLGHIAYSWSSGRCFVGDTLFFGGCGRLFEGTAAMMDHALNEVLSALPGTTLMYCGHEYTAANLAFACTVDPENHALQQLVVDVRTAREQGRSTVPSRLEQEWAVNPFMRCNTPAIRDAVGMGPEAPRHEVLGALRIMKDGYKAP